MIDGLNKNENPIHSAGTYDETGKAEKIAELETKKAEIERLEKELEKKKQELGEYIIKNQLLD
ncbi:MAG: hypothetical protein WC868_13085 [Bacteroidales bacterium]